MIPQTVGRYRIVRKLGEGGMGEVYLADDPALGRQVAIKVLPAASAADADARSRLVQEAQSAARFDHANVCAIYEVGEHDGDLFFAMQYVEGETLAHRIAQDPLEVGDALHIAEQVTDALADAHARGMIHHDIKPHNIMITARGQAKVLDFGLAKLVPDVARGTIDAETMLGLTAPGAVVGTTAYMSPEQLRGEPLDARTDIFSVGCVLYEMLSGRRPFARASAAGTIAAILNDPPPSLDSVTAVPADFLRIVRKALEKDKERRYQSARDLLVDIRNLRRDLGSTEERAAAVVPAHRVTWKVYASAAAIVVCLAALAGWIAWRRAPSTARSIRVLAILPFAAQPGTEYLGDGISETLINSLSQLPQLKIIARTTTFRYRSGDVDVRAIRRDLGVDAIVTGRVAQQNDMLVVQADLTDAIDGTEVWGQRFTRRLSDIFSLQEEIARAIAANLRLRLTGRETAGLSKRYTVNIDAYRNYLQGRTFAQRRTPADLQKAVGYYEQAIADDARYALAYAGLTDAYTNLAARGRMPLAEGRRKATEAANTALALDADLAEAHAAVGQTHVYAAPYDFRTGDRELRRAIELSPSWPIAYQYLGTSLIEQGRLDEGLQAWETARDLDPLSSFMGHLLAYAQLLERDYPRALTLQRQARQLGPSFPTFLEIEIYTENRAFAEALAELDRTTPGREGDPYLLYSRAILFVAENRRTEALAIVRQFEQFAASNPTWNHLLARIYLVLGDTDRAFDLMSRAVDAGGIPTFYQQSPMWDAVRGDARFTRLLSRMGVSAEK